MTRDTTGPGFKASESAVVPSSDLRAQLTFAIETADNLAAQGDYAEALRCLMQHVEKDSKQPGVQVRFAQWQMVLGNVEGAIQAALRELTIRPDNQKVLDVLLHDQEMLFKVLQESPPMTVCLVEQVMKAYLHRGTSA